MTASSQIVLLGVCLLSSASFGSQAMTNLVDAAAARRCFAAYTNNVLCVEQVASDEWSAERRLDRLPFNMPFQLVVGPEEADRRAAEAALKTIDESLPPHLRTYFTQHRLLAPLQQWLVRRYRPGVSNETDYLTAAAHPSVWRAADFDLDRLAYVARNLTSNSVPMMASVCPIYGEFEEAPIRRAQPFVDYPDPRPEETYALPFGTAIVLRAPEDRRKFRFFASGWPFSNRQVNFAWVAVRGGVWVDAYRGQREKFPRERGYGEATLNWSGAVRRDVLVFARYGEGPWGPPTVLSFYRVPNEQRQYDRKGLLSITYQQDRNVIPSLYQNKPWKDVFTRDSLGNVIGFMRTRVGQFRDEPFSLAGERIVETYAGDVPKITAKVRYFTLPNDPTTLDYEVTKTEVAHAPKPAPRRERGEFTILTKGKGL